jgi:hypothetical protein
MRRYEVKAQPMRDDTHRRYLREARGECGWVGWVTAEGKASDGKGPGACHSGEKAGKKSSSSAREPASRVPRPCPVKMAATKKSSKKTGTCATDNGQGYIGMRMDIGTELTACCGLGVEPQAGARGIT